MKIDNDDSSPLLCYVYSLHWWEFNQHKPLVEVNHAPSHIIDSQTRSSIPPKIQLMHLLFKSWVHWQLQMSDSSRHSCIMSREFTHDSVTKFLPAQFPWIWCKCLLRILIHSKIFNLTKYWEVLVKYSLLITQAGIPIWIWH